MLYVSYAYRAEDLLAALASDFAERSRAIPPLRRRVIAVPDREIAETLRHHLARAHGACANVDTPTLEAHLASLLSGPTSPQRILGRDQLQVLIANRLTDAELLGHADMQPVARYLRTRDADDAALRRVQLASELATLYAEYALSRPGLLRDWADRGVSDEATPTERWQRRLYLALTCGGDGYRVGGDGPRHLPLPLAVATSPREVLRSDLPLFVYGYSTLPPGTLLALEHLAAVRDVYLYAFNPCREYWEDLQAEGTDAPLLRYWGRPGRDFIRFLGEITGHGFSDRGRDGAAPDTLLGALQRDIAARAPERVGAEGSADGSVSILACPSPRREVEAIAGAIVDCLRSDSTLRLEDIAVRVAESEYERYRPLLSTVFAEFGGLPYHMAGVPLPAVCPASEALEHLFDLPLGTFTRPEMMQVLVHPAVAARYPDVDTGEWLRWAERLGIVHGADRSDHANTYIEDDLFNWDQGIRRLAMGAFMSGERSGDRRIVRIGHHEFVPESISDQQMTSAARLALLCRSLIADCRFARQHELPLSEWSRFFQAMISAYLEPLDAIDEQGLERCRRALFELAVLDLEGHPMSYRQARELARGALCRLRTSSSSGRGGVSIAPLRQLGARPFRVLFLAGLGEGSFPDTAPASSFDVRRGTVPGEVQPLERDRFVFLEALMTARDRLVLSYPCRHEASGEPLAASSVVDQLRAEIERGYTAENLVRTCRLNRYEESVAHLTSDPLGSRQAGALSLRRALEETGRGEKPRAELIAELCADHPEVAEHIALPRLPDLDRDPLTTVPLSRLRKFFEAPLTAWATTVVGLRDADLDDLLHRESERFASERLLEVSLLRDVFLAAARSGDSLETIYRDRARLEELSGATPTGVFSQVESERHLETLRAWRDHGGELGSLALHAFGRANERSAVDELRPPIGLVIAGNRAVDLVGTSHPVSGRGPVMLVDRPQPDDRHQLRGLIETLILRAAGLLVGPSEILLLSRSGLSAQRVAATSQDQACGLLAAAVGELLDREHNYFLPCEVVFKHRKKPQEDLRRLAAKVLSEDRHSEIYGPVSDFSQLDAALDLGAIVERRFGPIYALLEDG